MEVDVQVLEFDDSVDNHLKAVATISTLSGQPQIHQLDTDDAASAAEIASSITFLRQWRDFAYEPRAVNFSPHLQHSQTGCDIKLPQFSSAAIPKDTQTTLRSSDSSKEFILYCGGPIWGLDWCPQVRQDSGGSVKCEFLAVASHPPGSSYHQLGAPLIGRGVIQIWCFVHAEASGCMEELSMATVYNKSHRGRPRKNPDICHGSEETLRKQSVVRPSKELATKSTEQKMSKKRGRPRKKQLIESESISESGDHIKLIDYHHANTEFVGGQSKFQNMLTRTGKHKVLKNQNNMSIESQNAVCAADSLGLLHDNETCQALVPYLVDQSAQPVASDEVVMQPSTSGKSWEIMPATLQSGDFVSADDFVPIHATNVSDDDAEVLLIMKRMKDRATQPIKTYVRRHKLAKTTKCKETVNTYASNPDQSMTCIDDKDYFKSDDLDLGTQVGQRKRGSTKFPAPSSTLQYDEEFHLGNPRTELTDEVDANTGSCTRDTEYTTTTNAGLGPLLLCNTTSREEVVRSSTDIIIPQDVAFPRLALCLAHNGKVAWDVKWRPVAHLFHPKVRMGYLAVLLGNGSLEVWDVPLPSVVCDIFSPSRTEGTDPRFIKLKPVFKCSKLMFKGKQSIPLTVEWSASFPNDLLLAGCHDGTVAVWKFSEGNLCKDTRPLLCFRADTTAIRAVSWAPAENDKEDAKVIVTAGHGGLKFWDIRDPFYPLWTHPSLRIYSVDWMPKPRCIVISSDDGSLKLLGISEVSNDLSVTGKPFSGSKLQGLHTFNCSPYAIWSVHISRVTGMAAYCSADGTVVRFQLTTKAVEKDHSRYRVPHYLFGSLSGNDLALTINTPPSNTATQLNKPHAGPQSMRALLDLCNLSQPNSLQPKESAVEDRKLALWDANEATQEQHMATASACPISMIEDGESNLAMVCQVVGPKKATVQENPIKPAVKPNGPPHKILAMHRVRWNLNKGSERWLCSGGAAGIVRCQEMVFTDVDKMYLRDK